MTFKLFDFGDESLVEPPHSCDLSCGQPCVTYVEVKAQELIITYMKDALDEQLRRYRRLRTKMNVRHDPIVKRLPLEIATTIFELCLPKQHYGINPNRFSEGKEDNASALFTLGAVCKTWREIIWSTIRFWSHLDIRIRQSNIHTTTYIVKEWLARTGQMPLSVRVHHDRDYGSVDIHKWADEVLPLSQMITANSKRWRCIDLRLPPIFLQMFSGVPSEMRELRIATGLHDYDDSDELISFSVNGSSKPSPSFVEIVFIPIECIDIIWANVTHVQGQGFDAVDCVNIINTSPKLKHCVFILSDCMGFALPYTRPLFHRNLQKLHVHLSRVHENIVIFLLSISTFPRLQELCIETMEEPLPDDAIISFLERSQCQLHTLEIHAVLEEESFMSFLRDSELDSVRRLSISPSHKKKFPARSFFKLLARTIHLSEESEESDNYFLPMLDQLRYITSSTEECEEIWDIIPDIFGGEGDYDDDGQDLDSDVGKRALTALTVTFQQPQMCILGPSWSFDSHLRKPAFISQPTLHCINKLQGARVDIKIVISLENGDNEDFIASSIAHHCQNAEEESVNIFLTT